MNDNIVNIVLTGDENYVVPMGVAMFSIVKNLKRTKKARFFLLVSGWGEKQEKEIRKLENCIIEIIHVEQYLNYFDKQSAKNFKLGYIKNLTPYYRLLIPKILPDDIDKCFYFDADMICDADLSALQDSIPDNILTAAVAEFVANEDYEIVLKHVKEWKEFSAFNQDRFNAPYFNAGFFFMNLKMAKELKVFDDFMNFLKAHPNPPYADQDTLNAICGQKYHDKMLFLKPNWNVFADMSFDADFYGITVYPYHMVKEAFFAPYIYHYAGPNKPWQNEDCLNYINVWRKYFSLSPFYNSNLMACEYKKKKILWVSVFGIPTAKITMKSNEYKSYLFGLLPIKRCYCDKKKYYFLGIPVLKLLCSKTGDIHSGYLFFFLPIIKAKRKDK